MGRYDNRVGSQASGLRWDPADARDDEILAWWDDGHIEALENCIRDFQWSWQFRCADYVREAMSEDVFITWARRDRRIRPHGNPHYDESWNLWAGGAEGLINRFCWAYGHVHGLTSRIRPSAEVSCGRCGKSFEEHSVPDNLLERLTIAQIDFCTPCLRDTLMRFNYGEAGDDAASRDQIASFAKRLTELVSRIPPADFGYSHIGSLWGLSTPERAEVLELITTRPSRRRINKLYGSWLAALVDAGVLEGDAHRTARGTRSVASDGHVCLSLGERAICEALTEAGITHDKEVRYPEGNYRADFRIGSTLIEYVGLMGDLTYDAKTILKQEIAARHGIRLEVIVPNDLANTRALSQRLRRIATAEGFAPAAPAE